MTPTKMAGRDEITEMFILGYIHSDKDLDSIFDNIKPYYLELEDIGTRLHVLLNFLKDIRTDKKHITIIGRLLDERFNKDNP